LGEAYNHKELVEDYKDPGHIFRVGYVYRNANNSPYVYPIMVKIEEQAKIIKNKRTQVLNHFDSLEAFFAEHMTYYYILERVRILSDPKLNDRRVNILKML